jgi:hypothetical protein
MKQLLLAVVLMFAFAAPTWAVTLEELGSGQSAMNTKLQAIADNDDANTTVILDAVNGIVVPPVDLSPAINATTAAETNVLNAIAGIQNPTVTIVTIDPCIDVVGGVDPFPGEGRFVMNATEVCDKKTGDTWWRFTEVVDPLGPAPNNMIETGTYFDAVGLCAAKGAGYTLPTIEQIVGLYLSRSEGNDFFAGASFTFFPTVRDTLSDWTLTGTVDDDTVWQVGNANSGALGEFQHIWYIHQDLTGTALRYMCVKR